MTGRRNNILGPASGAFATGRCNCVSRPAARGDGFNRLMVPIAIGNMPLEGVIDTGGAYFMIDPELAAAAGIDPAAALLSAAVRVRGIAYEGSLYRLPLTLVADEGDNLTFEATTFVANPERNPPWALPPFLGWHGCLERVRIAIDSIAGDVYFGMPEP
jgi:hypothetical protein